jgi:hypothetical protein
MKTKQDRPTAFRHLTLRFKIMLYCSWLFLRLEPFQMALLALIRDFKMLFGGRL